MSSNRVKLHLILARKCYTQRIDIHCLCYGFGLGQIGVQCAKLLRQKYGESAVILSDIIKPSREISGSGPYIFAVDDGHLRSLFEFMTAPSESLRRRVYNLTAMSFTPEELVCELSKHVPDLRGTYSLTVDRISVPSTIQHFSNCFQEPNISLCLISQSNTRGRRYSTIRKHEKIGNGNINMIWQNWSREELKASSSARWLYFSKCPNFFGYRRKLCKSIPFENSKKMIFDITAD